MALSPKQRKQALEKGLAIQLAGDDEKYLSPNPKAALQLFTRPLAESESSDELPADRLTDRQTVDRIPRRN